jgi:tripartite-type tricarboxylate transporter receptor subunit TctC
MSALRRATLLSVMLLFSQIALSQAPWPERTVQLIVPFPAGGGVDALARPFADILGEILHQSIVVVPRDGAAGTIGAGFVASAKPDGYTLAFTPNGPITVQPHVIPGLAYKMDSEIDSAMLNIGGARAQGFRTLATFAETRSTEIPDTPTVKELGYPVVSSAFGGLFAPKGLPTNIVKQIDSACEKVVADERFRRATRQASQESLYRNSSDFARVLAADYAIKGDVVKRAGIKAP